MTTRLLLTKTARTKQLATTFALAGFAALFSLPLHAQTVAGNMSGAPATASEQSDLRLALDKVNLAAESGKLAEAHSMLDRLKARYPGNPDVAAAEEDLDSRLEDRNSTLSQLCSTAASLDPGQMDILQREHQAGKGYACAGYNRRITDEAYEQIESLTASNTIISPDMNLTVDLENDHINSNQPFTRANGKILSFYDNRQQGTVMLDKTFNNHSEAAASIYAIGDTAGAGLQYMMKDRWGATSIQANFNQPDWDYIETSVEYGTKDNIKIERKQVFNDNLQAMLAAGFNHYSLADDWSAADAPGWNFDLEYNRPVSFSDQAPNTPEWMNDEVTFGARYSVEAEYFTYVGRRMDVDGNTFNPLPATTYEVHTFDVSATKAILPDLNAEVEGGYAVNRIAGNSGPVYGGSLNYNPLQHFGIDLHASRNLLGGQNNGEKEDIVGTDLKLTW